MRTEDLPAEFSWANKDGVSYVTKNLNQHIPQVRWGSRKTHPCFLH